MPSPFLAVDWGTTNCRAWVVDGNGRAGRHQEFPHGVSKLAAGEAAKRFHDTIRPALGAEGLPAIMCGMIGSNLGWELVPYLDCPADLDDLRSALHRVEAEGPPVWIVPGLRAQRPDGGPDVMRGEETHVIGWVAEDRERCRGEHLICHPGTHAKWVRLVDGQIQSFVSVMTGELFDVLRKHSVLQVREAEEDEGAFEAGLKAAGDGNALASRLFTTRSRVVGGDMSPTATKSYLSGLLIGAEIAGVPSLFGVDARTPVTVVGDLELAGRYRRALEARGYGATVYDGEEAVIAGLKALVREEPNR